MADGMIKTTAGAPHVVQSIALVMADIATTGIAKARKNQVQGYTFRGIDDVYNALAPVLSQHGLVILPKVMSRACEARETAKGGTLYSVVLDVLFTLYSARDGSSVEVVAVGEAMDSGDKATNKAMSAAYKYMAMQVFCIPTEGDHDADASTPEPTRGSSPTKPAPASAPPKPTAEQWAADQRRAINACDTIAALDALSARLYASPGFKKLQADQPQMSMDLRSAVTARLAELQDALPPEDDFPGDRP